MSDRPSKRPAGDEAIEAEAARWLTEQEDGLSPAQAAEFARWRAADPRHAAAVEMLEETCGLLSRLPLLQADPQRARELDGLRTPTPMPARDKIVRFPMGWRIAVALAACFAVMAAVWWLQATRVTFNQTYVTKAGGFLRVPLPDDSVLELNSATEVRVQYSKALRRVTLAQGEAHFTVAKNPARPFLVAAGQVAVRAVGTAFNVRLEKSQVEVTVTEGRVAVSQSAGAVESPLLVAGQRVTVSADGTSLKALAPAAVETVTAIDEALAWRAPRLVFVDTPLAEVVRQFNQHNRLQLEIGDAELGRRAVGGTFRADHVETFVRLFEDSRDIAVERPSPERIVLRQVKR